MKEVDFDSELYTNTEPKESVDDRLVSCNSCKNKGKGMLEECYKTPRHKIVCGWFTKR